MLELKDEEIMLRYKNGETEAMDELLKRYKNPIYHFILRLNFNCNEAEDIAQEVFLTVHKYKDRYKPSGKLSTWIFTIAHNLFVSRFRKRKWLCVWPRKEGSDELVDFESNDPSQKDIVFNDELSNIIKQCIQGLPFLQKEALILREYENLDYQEIAIILKKPMGTVKILIYRARMNLKDKLLPYVKELGGAYNV